MWVQVIRVAESTSKAVRCRVAGPVAHLGTQTNISYSLGKPVDSSGSLGNQQTAQASNLVSPDSEQASSTDCLGSPDSSIARG